MAVLVEAISIVIKADELLAAFGGDWDAFRLEIPNMTLCADGELVRVGFMTPTDVEAFVKWLAGHGLKYLDEGAAKDLVVVDQLRGPMEKCDWIEFGYVDLDNDPTKKVAVCRLRASGVRKVVTPDGWHFDGSLSSAHGFVPSQHVDKSLIFLRHENGVDVYWSKLTGRETYVGRAKSVPS